MLLRDFFRLLVGVLLVLAATTSLADATNPRVRVETSAGTFIIQLDSENAPLSVINFLTYAKEGFYEGTLFHRVIPGFMVQGGGLDGAMQRKPTHDPITNEANNGLKNNRGTVAMARTGKPHSATAQFFVNLVDNDFLNHTGENTRGWGYTVFGKVIEGMPVIDKIAGVRTGTQAGRPNVPVTPVVINKVTVIPDE